MESRAAIGLGRIGARQRIDAHAIHESAVWPDAFHHRHTSHHATVVFSVDPDIAAPVTDPHQFAIGDLQCGGILSLCPGLHEQSQAR